MLPLIQMIQKESDKRGPPPPPPPINERTCLLGISPHGQLDLSAGRALLSVYLML